MGWKWEAVCRACNKEFWASWGHSRRNWELRCEDCGERSGFGRSSTGPGPPPDSLHPTHAAEDQAFTELPEDAPGRDLLPRTIDLVRMTAEWADWQQRAEAWFKVRCKCGGRYTFDAPERCPKCRSTDLFPKEGGFWWYTA
jgi:hypothetical protein